MKNFLHSIVFLCCVFIVSFPSCNTKTAPTVKYAHGNPGEVLVVMPEERWNSESGAIVQSVFAQEILTLPVEEPLFSLFHVNKNQFDSPNTFHKNIIYQDINPNIEKSNIKIINNKFAKNQVFVHVLVKSQSDFVKVISEHKDLLINIFLKAEKQRLIKNYSKYFNRNSYAVLKHNFNIELMVPQKFKVDVNKKNFVWMSNETHKYTQNILVFSLPCNDSVNISESFLISYLNKVLKENVPGERKGSYMTLETEYDYPVYSNTKVLKIETGTLNGLWKVKGDFMGGPFVSYSKIDSRRNILITTFGFVYHPNGKNRNLIRELDACFNTFDFVF